MSAGKNLFDKQKSECFAKLDLSRKGSIDQPILNIIQTFNQHNDYFSLSSCRYILLSLLVTPSLTIRGSITKERGLPYPLLIIYIILGVVGFISLCVVHAL